MTNPRRRLPVEPLLRQAGSWTAVARALGYDDWRHMLRHTNVARYAQNGLTRGAADELACALNLHPLTVWGDEWFEAGDVGPYPRLRNREPRWGLIGAELEAAS